MLRRLIALATVLVLGLQVLPASALSAQYSSNVSLNAGVYYPTAQYSSVYTPYPAVPSLQIPESPYNPGGPFLTPILNNWLHWGNIFNWAPSANYGGYGLYNTGPYGNYGEYGATQRNAQGYYVGTAGVQKNPVAMYGATSRPQASAAATYVGTSVPQSAPQALYASTARPNQTPQASYVSTTQADFEPQASYVTTDRATFVPQATYQSTVTTEKVPTATYASTGTVEKSPTATYVATATAATPQATYTPTATVQRDGPSASYISTPSVANGALGTLERNLPWVGNGGNSGSNVGIASLERNLPGTASNTQVRSGPAFGSLFGDGRDPSFDGNVTDGFLTRLRSQTSPTYTSRAENLANSDYRAYFGMDPAVVYNLAPDYAYDSAFPSYNLNATPSRVVTPSQAVNQAARDTSLAVPLQRYSTYDQDLRLMENRGLGIVVEQWKKQSPERQLTRLNVMNLAIALRIWRDTGRAPTSQSLMDQSLERWPKDAQGQVLKTIPLVHDMAITDDRLTPVVTAAYLRLMYMPDLVTKGVQVVSFRADPDNTIERAQTLQSLMTALYLRPDTSILRGGYKDLPAEAWYTPWALTARTYGLNYGERFDATHKMSQEEAAYMVATLLRQLR